MKSVNKLITRIISIYSQKLYFQIAYFHHRKRLPNLKNPQDLSELWIKRLLEGKINYYYYLADKYEVRKYVKECGCENILPHLYGFYTQGSQFDMTTLPEKFALKANWGATMNLICVDKSKYTQEMIRKQIDSWLSTPSYNNNERHYDLIKRKIICEEFIDDGTGGFPIDYKFICLKGNIRVILVCNGRETGHADYIPYDIHWNAKMDYCISKHEKSEILPRPKNLESMIATAKRLASGIDMVRIDLYSNGSKIWFGEMTLTPDGCIFRRWTQKAIDEMGDYYRTH
ncbi:MAG: hypothetical protein K6G92_08590 [Bacteroidaceae bacterium]|nr:hypothetical protein [Bacteroidaceae bacterium]